MGSKRKSYGRELKKFKVLIVAEVSEEKLKEYFLCRKPLFEILGKIEKIEIKESGESMYNG